MLTFTLSHGLGNDYLVVDGRAGRFNPTLRAVRQLCNRHTGVGSDGVLVHVESTRGDFGLRLFNPDGSEAEKSGNGLRIFAHYLWTSGLTTAQTFTIELCHSQELAQAQLHLDESGLKDITMDMGRARFTSVDIPSTLPGPEAVEVPLHVGDTTLSVTAVNLGNPHCVIFVDDLNAVDLTRLGPLIETHAAFPRRTNVQFAGVTGPDRIAARIWERGAGHTLASGSSACAVAAAAVKTGRAQGSLTIQMEGGDLHVDVGPDFELRQRGPVQGICTGEISPDLARAMGLEP